MKSLLTNKMYLRKNSTHIIFVLTLSFFVSKTYCQSIGDPLYDANVDSYRIIAVSNDSLESKSNTISVEKPYALYAPTAFSPDGDGINDFFNVVGQGLTNYTIEIYNRWGQMVFKSYDMNVKWDGNFRNKKAPAGTYVYKVNSIDFGSEIKLIKSGSVSLVR